MIKKTARWLLNKLAPTKPDQRCGAISMRHFLKKWNKEELVEAYIKLVMSGDRGHDWYGQYTIYEHEYKRLKQILESQYHTDKDLNRALHMSDLEKKVKKLKSEVRYMQEMAEVHNETAYATGLIVNCTGCEAGKPFKGEELTEERVKRVEMLARRLRTWFTNHQHRLEREGNK